MWVRRLKKANPAPIANNIMPIRVFASTGRKVFVKIIAASIAGVQSAAICSSVRWKAIFPL